MKELQYKSFVRPLESKEAREDGTLHIKAYALVFGNIDSYGDIIAEGACDAFLKSENADRIRLCYQHDMNEVIGVITDKGVDANGMWIEADILPTTKGKDVQILMRGEAINEFSIGYWADEYHFEKRGSLEVRILDAITILEVSPVTRAANPKAVVVDMKSEQIAEENENLLTDKEDMEEMKKQLEALEQKAASAEQRAAEKDAAFKTAQENINNLDASVKAQEQTIAELRKMIAEQPKSFASAMREALESKKADIEKFIKGTGTYTIEFKVATPTGASYATELDPEVYGVPVLGNAFLLAFRNTTTNGARVAWMEATTEKNVGYVAELAEASKTEVTFLEKNRAMAKIATFMEISSEVEGWFNMLYEFCVAEGQRLIMKKVDAEAWLGDGNDSSAPKHIYGIKAVATPFAKLGTYDNANVGDVVLDAIAQIKKAGYRADRAIVSYATEAALKGVKDANGNYLYNQLTGMFGQVQVLPSDNLTDSELVVADSFCADVKFSPLYELEFSRQASTDSWRVDFRRHAQVIVPTPKAKGIVYVADKAAAITAISK
jgi:HK97 family phage prohead protease/HK97 family phage major capsid protein